MIDPAHEPAGWRRTTSLGAQIGRDADEVWHSPSGRTFAVRSRYGKSVDPRAIKGSSDDFRAEVERVRACVAGAMQKYRFEQVAACPVCDETRSNAGVSVHGIGYRVCVSCTHAFTERRLLGDDLQRYYAESAEYVPVHVSAATARARMERIARPKIALVLEQYARVHGGMPRVLLDVGAGAGHIVAAAREAGIDAHGLEPSRIGREAAAALHGVELIDARLETFRPSSGSPLDVITFWGVVEHTPDPRTYVQRARQLLRPRAGLLFLEVPRYDSLSTRLETIVPGLGTRHLEGLEHINCFTDASVATLLERCGFAPVFVWYLGLDWYEFAMRSWYATGNDAVARLVLDHFDVLQQLNDASYLADGMIVGAVPVD